MTLAAYRLLQQSMRGRRRRRHRVQQAPDGPIVEVRLLAVRERFPTHGKLLRRQLRRASMLEHPAALPIVELNLDQEPPFVVTGLFEGPSLRDHWPNGPQMSEFEVLALANELATVLTASSTGPCPWTPRRREYPAPRRVNCVSISPAGPGFAKGGRVYAGRRRGTHPYRCCSYLARRRVRIRGDHRLAVRCCARTVDENHGRVVVDERDSRRADRVAAAGGTADSRDARRGTVRSSVRRTRRGAIVWLATSY